MPATQHIFPVTVQWTGGRDGTGEMGMGESGKNFPINVPSGFSGPGGETNPEELLTGAIAGCYSITFGIIAANRKLPVVDVKTEAIGEVEQNGAAFKYKQITIKPTITLSAEATDEQVASATDFAHKTDGYCIVTNAVRQSVEIVLEPTVVRANG